METRNYAQALKVGAPPPPHLNVVLVFIAASSSTMGDSDRVTFSGNCGFECTTTIRAAAVVGVLYEGHREDFDCSKYVCEIRPVVDCRGTSDVRMTCKILNPNEVG